MPEELPVSELNRIRGIQNLRPPLVSYIVPCYNKEKYIATALQSILMQEYRNIEIVFIDDGSTDRSLEIAREILGEAYIRCKIFQNKENYGLGYSLSWGYAQARGEYLCFLSADDQLIDVNKTARQVEVMEATPCTDITFFNRFFTGPSLSNSERIVISPILKLPLLSRTLLFIFLIEGINFIGSLSLMHRATSYRALGEWDPDLRNLNDHDLILKQVLNGAKIRMLDGCPVFYRDNPDQLSKHPAFNEARDELERQYVDNALRGEFPWYMKAGVRFFCHR